MPLYEYICQECQHPFEVLVFGGDEPECPSCHGKKLERQLSLPARPRSEPTSLPTACQSSGPPCGPVCSRWKQ
jgi:putative FmdB family regulatory protein